MNKTIEEIKIIWGSKKDFEDKFGDEHGIHIPSKEIWEWINKHFTPNTEVQKKVEEYAKMGFKDGQQELAQKVLNGMFFSDGDKYPYVENWLYNELEGIAGITSIKDDSEMAEEQ